MWIFALTIFTGAFLLFQVQPLIAKFILRWFGGSAAVWTTCMLFFQIFLVAGYGYAHAATRWLEPRRQAVLHGLLVLAALFCLPITPDAGWKPGPEDDPVWRILLLLTVSLGLPYFVLSATGPLLQAWFSRLHPDVPPYRLYALSNAGSFLALLSYPFVVEPALARHEQAGMWGWGFGIYGILSALCIVRLWRGVAVTRLVKKPAKRPAGGQVAPLPDAVPPAGDRLLWLAFPACGTLLLLACTNKLCQDVASVPFLWVAPLSLYLLTFVICFDRPLWYARRLFTWLQVPVLGLLCFALFRQGSLGFPVQIAIYCAVLFFGCMVCHGEVYRLRPAPRHLTSFYLMISVGGAIGGLLVAVVAPKVLRNYSELHWAVWLLAAMVLWVHVRERTGWNFRGRRLPVWPVTLAAAVVLGLVLIQHLRSADREVIARQRNFYGVLRIVEIEKNDPEYHARMLLHGRINHGLQFLHPEKEKLPTMYFNEPGGAGVALDYYKQRGARHIGVVGLGVGTLAAYGRKGDTMRFYEIDPDVRELAESKFSFLRNCEAEVELVMGDARLSMEREAPQDYDVLILDAFSSDSIPVHLLTREAFELYLRHVKPTGVIAVHTSNKYLDLFPVVLAAANHHGVGMIFVPWGEKPMPLGYASSNWILVSRNRDFLYDKEILSHARRPFSESSLKPVEWTDDHASLFRILLKRDGK